MGFLGVTGGAGGLSASSGADTGGAKGGNIGGHHFTFGGINTATQVPAWVWPVGFVAVVGIAYLMFRKK